MNFHRIYAVILRHLYAFRKNLDRLTDVFYWPLVDLLLWGLTGVFIEKQTASIPSLALMLISGTIFWLIVWRGCAEITISTLSELWDKNLINLFVTPLKFSEWMTAFLFLSVMKALVSFLFGVGIAFLLYKLRLLLYGFYLLPFILILLTNGWSVGFFVAGLVLRYGAKAQNLAWTAVYVLSPFVAIFYPVSVLPSWAQRIASIIPASHIFESMRIIISNGTLDPRELYLAGILSILYLLLSLIFLYKSFQKALRRGLVGLH